MCPTIVHVASGFVNTRVLPVVIPDNWNWSCFVPSTSSLTNNSESGIVSLFTHLVPLYIIKFPDAGVVIVQSDKLDNAVDNDNVWLIHFDDAVLYCNIWLLLGADIVQSVNPDNDIDNGYSLIYPFRWCSTIL